MRDLSAELKSLNADWLDGIRFDMQTADLFDEEVAA